MGSLMKTNTELALSIGRIESKEDLREFVSALRRNLDEDPDSWENPTLDRYLQAMEAWMGSMENYYGNTGQTPPTTPTWRTIADILYASKIYE
jgi:hypothetical protein